MMRLLRLEAKLQRFEFGTIVMGTVLLAAAGFAFVYILGSYGLAPECLVLDDLPDECDFRLVNQFNTSSRLGDVLFPAIGIWPWIVGILLGVGLVARDVEHRQAPLIWTLTFSRGTWLLRRALILIVVVAALMTIPAAVAVLMQAAERLGVNPLASFEHHQARGMLLVARSILAFTVATFVGAILGRVVPGLIVSAVAGAVLFVAATASFPYLMPAAELPVGERGVSDAGAVIFGSHYRLSGGESFASYDALVASAPVQVGTAQFVDWFSRNVTQIPVGYPGRAALEVGLREAALTLVLAGVALAGAVRVIETRKPY